MTIAITSAWSTSALASRWRPAPSARATAALTPPPIPPADMVCISMISGKTRDTPASASAPSQPEKVGFAGVHRRLDGHDDDVGRGQAQQGPRDRALEEEAGSIGTGSATERRRQGRRGTRARRAIGARVGSAVLRTPINPWAAMGTAAPHDARAGAICRGHRARPDAQSPAARCTDADHEDVCPIQG